MHGRAELARVGIVAEDGERAGAGGIGRALCPVEALLTVKRRREKNGCEDGA
jgi:hypothetical protein